MPLFKWPVCLEWVVRERYISSTDPYQSDIQPGERNQVTTQNNPSIFILL